MLMMAFALSLTSANPLMPAAVGKMQCYHPDRVHHTCRSLASYAAHGNGGYDNKAIVLLSARPVVTMTTVTPVTLDNDAVCGAIRAEDIALAMVDVDGSALTGDALSGARQRIAGAMENMFGHRICTRYIADGDALRAEATIDGTPRRDANDTVIWVSPGDGYRVAP